MTGIRAYQIAVALLVVARVCIGIWLLHDDPAHALGVATGTLFWGLIPAAINWYLNGARHKPDGKFKTWRLMFWCSLVLPLLAMGLQKR
jgi:hypothetical protein